MVNTFSILYEYTNSNRLLSLLQYILIILNNHCCLTQWHWDFFADFLLLRCWCKGKPFNYLLYFFFLMTTVVPMVAPPLTNSRAIDNARLLVPTVYGLLSYVLSLLLTGFFSRVVITSSITVILSFMIWMLFYHLCLMLCILIEQVTVSEMHLLFHRHLLVLLLI